MPDDRQAGIEGEAAEMIRVFEETAREELRQIVERIRTDESTAQRLGMAGIEQIGEGAYVVLARGRAVALRAGLTGETHNSDRLDLYRRGLAGPAIFVNAVECVVSDSRDETQESVIAEIGDQLDVHGVTNA